jgi:hypothetical protein
MVHHECRVAGFGLGNHQQRPIAREARLGEVAPADASFWRDGEHVPHANPFRIFVRLGCAGCGIVHLTYPRPAKEVTTMSIEQHTNCAAAHGGRRRGVSVAG